MTTAVKTRGVFGLVAGFAPQSVLLVQTEDKKWRLPGGFVEKGETDETALKREANMMTGLDLRLVRQIGPDLENLEGIVAGYECVVGGGQLLKPHKTEDFDILAMRYCTPAEIIARAYTTAKNDQTASHPLKIVGPRTWRMVWDFLSLKEKPTQGTPKDFADIRAIDPLAKDKLMCLGAHFYLVTGEGKNEHVSCWPRLHLT